MMLEIEKLYKNAGVEKDWKPLPYGDIEEYYPEFTAEKQLEMIKWLANNKDIEISEHFMDLKIKRTYCVSRRGFQFEESLAELVNLIWQSLSDTEKAEIKRILE